MEPEEEIQNPVADVMPDKLRDYLMTQKQNRPLYADNSGMSQFAGSVKNAFKTPEAKAAPSDFKQQARDPYSNFATSAATGHGNKKIFYSKSQNKTKIVYPDGTEEIVNGRVTK